MAVPLPEPRSYEEYFSSDDRDPYLGQYRALLSVFRTTNAPPAALLLYYTVGNADPQYPAAYLGLCRDVMGIPRYYLVFGLSKYPTLVGQPTPWDNQLFAFVGDVVEGAITTVIFPPDAFEFHRVGGTSQNVPGTLARARELLEAEPDLPFIAPLADGEANIRQVRTRRYVPLPHKFVRYFLDRRPTAREGFIDLSLQLEALGNPNECGELVDWLLCSITADEPGVEPSLISNPPQAPLADRLLHRHRLGVMKGHVRGLDQDRPHTGIAATQLAMAATLEGMAQDQRRALQEARDRAQEAKAPRTVSEVLGTEVARTLMALCQAEEEAELPPFWLDLAAAGLKRDRMTLQEALLAKGRAQNMTDAAPIATPDLVKKVVGLHWAGLNMDDLSEGIQPFVLILHDYTNSDLGVEAQRRADTYDILQGASAAATLQDAQALKTAKAIIPRDLSEARAQLVANLLLWSVLVGDGHPFVYSLGTLVQEYTGSEYMYQNLLKALTVEAPPAALLLRFVQLKTVNYWRTAANNRRLPEAPKFNKVLQKLAERNHGWIPTLPTRYWKPLARTVPVGGSMVRSTVSSLGTSVPGHTLTDPGSSVGSRTPSAASTGSRQAPAKNPGVNQVFAAFADKIRAMTLRDAITKGGNPPLVERNGVQSPMCLAYHLKGECWSGCSRREDHGPHTESEDQLLANWCQATYGA